MNHELNKNTGAFFENNPNPMWIYDPATLHILKVNEAATVLYRYTKQQMEALTIKDLRPKSEIPKLLDEVNKNVQSFNNAGIWQHQTSNGEPIFVRILSYPIKWDQKMCKMVVAQDVSDQMKTEQELEQTRKELQHSYEQYDLVVKATQDAIYDWNIIEDRLEWDESFKSSFIHNLDQDKYSIENWAQNVHPDDLAQTRKSLENALESPSQDQWESEYRFKKPDGSYATVLEKGFIIRDKLGNAIRMVGALQDITELKEKEEKIRASLKEKEALLAEVHHRVKNNMAVVSSLMQLQIFEEDDNKTKTKLLDCVSRIQSIAQIHEYLYHSEDFSNIDFSRTFESLAKNILETFQEKQHVNLYFKLDAVRLNVNQAVTASLIVNEVTTSILKERLETDKNYSIQLELSQQDDQITLRITYDTNSKFPGQHNSEESLSRKLIDILAKQLEATYKYKSLNDRSTFSLDFKRSDK